MVGLVGIQECTAVQIEAIRADLCQHQLQSMVETHSASGTDLGAAGKHPDDAQFEDGSCFDCGPQVFIPRSRGWVF